MKTLLLLSLFVGLIYFYFGAPTQSVESSVSARPARTTVAAQTVIVAAAPSYNDRWKIGPTAQTDLKTGPNAQTDFAPFAPSEQANWNNTPGCTIVRR